MQSLCERKRGRKAYGRLSSLFSGYYAVLLQKGFGYGERNESGIREPVRRDGWKRRRTCRCRTGSERYVISRKGETETKTRRHVLHGAERDLADSLCGICAACFHRKAGIGTGSERRGGAYSGQCQKRHTCQNMCERTGIVSQAGTMRKVCAEHK